MNTLRKFITKYATHLSTFGDLFMMLAIVLLYFGYTKQKELAERWENNYESEVLFSANQQILTAKQFKKYESDIDSLANVLKISTKQIRQVIVTDYKVKYDTIVKTVIKYDTTKNITKFEALHPTGCYLIAGETTGHISDISINKVENNDILTTFIYDDRGYFFFNIIPKFWKDHLITCKIYSECKNDTISVTKNYLLK